MFHDLPAFSFSSRPALLERYGPHQREDHLIGSRANTPVLLDD